MARPQSTTDQGRLEAQDKRRKVREQQFKMDMFLLLQRPEFHRFLGHMWEEDAFPPRGGCNFYPSGSDQYYKAGRASAGAYLEQLVNEHGTDQIWLAIRHAWDKITKEKDDG